MHFHNPRRRHFHISAVYLTDYGSSQLQESAPGHRILIQSNRSPLITALADTLHDRNLSQQGYVHFLSQSLCAFFSKDIILVFRQFGRREPSHVLHQTENGHIHLIIGKHIDAFAGICQRHSLRRANNDSSCQCQSLHHCQVNVARSGRKVDKEIIQFSPIGITNQLLQGIACHTSPPQSGLVGVYKETDGKQLDAILLYRNNQVTSTNVLCHRTGIFHLEHLWNRRPEDISIQQTYFITQLCQRHGKVGSNRGLAYPTFSRRHSDNILHLG